MPYDSIGVIVFVIGDHAAPLYNVVSFQLLTERLLWDARLSRPGPSDRTRFRQEQSGLNPVTDQGGCRTSRGYETRRHPPTTTWANLRIPAYGGVINVTMGDTSLMFDFHKIKMPLSHFHYDRFDTPDDEEDGKYSVNFLTNLQQGDLTRSRCRWMRRPSRSTRRVLAALRARKRCANIRHLHHAERGGGV